MFFFFVIDIYVLVFVWEQCLRLGDLVKILQFYLFFSFRYCDLFYDFLFLGFFVEWVVFLGVVDSVV